MNVPLWAVETAAEFWRLAGDDGVFPRDLRRAILRAEPLRLVIALLPKLLLSSMKSWLDRNGIACDLDQPDRPLRAALVARNGSGIAFIDGTDAEAEQRFSLAHELAHFLRDYWRPRRQVLQRLGPAAIEVVDGLRPATHDERLHALLSSTTIGFHVHLLDRDPEGRPTSRAIARAEEDADHLAFELLAPAEHVLATVAGRRQRRLVEQALLEVYGFPEVQAAEYVKVLLPSAPHDPLLHYLRTPT